MVKVPRIWYRSTQFFSTLWAPFLPVDVAYAAAHLTPGLMALFRRMSRVEQHHGIAVCRTLESQGYQDTDLLTAALLHDVGKITAPPRLWERVIVVLAEHFLPARSERWAQEKTPRGWHRGFVIRRMHPVWGAELAAQAGASPCTVALIRQHHRTVEGDALLAALQAADDA